MLAMRNLITLSFLVLLTVVKGQVTTTLRQTNLKVLPNSFIELNLISQDVTNEIKQDTTDVSITFEIKNQILVISPSKFDVIKINSTADYQCYLTLVNWRVPVTSMMNIDLFLSNFMNSSCGDFGRAVSQVEESESYETGENDLFTKPQDANITNLFFIVDNTQQVDNLKAYLQFGTAANLTYIGQTLFLQHSIAVIYKLSDGWFITTVTFACLDFIVLITAVTLFILYKKRRQQHINFRRRKDRLAKYDNMYKDKAHSHVALQNELDNNNQDGTLNEDLLNNGRIQNHVQSLDFTNDQKGSRNEIGSSQAYGVFALPLLNNEEESKTTTPHHHAVQYQTSFNVPRVHSQLTVEQRQISMLVKSNNNVAGMPADQQAEGFFQGVTQSNRDTQGKPYLRGPLNKQTSGGGQESILSRELSGAGGKYKAPKKRSNLFD